MLKKRIAKLEAEEPEVQREVILFSEGQLKPKAKTDNPFYIRLVAGKFPPNHPKFNDAQLIQG